MEIISFMNIVYIFDEQFSTPAYISILSLLINNTELDEIDFFIFDDGINDSSRKDLFELVKKYNRNIKFITPIRIIQMLKKMDVIPWRGRYSAYVKFFLQDYLPKEINRVIFLDADTIIDDSLRELNDMSLNGHPCAMALEAVHNKYKEYSGIGDNELYNTGVIVFDMDEWRKNKVEEKFLKHLKDICCHYMFPEEDPISVVLCKNVQRLSPDYNYITMFYYYATEKYFQRYQWNDAGNKFYSLEELVLSQKSVKIYHCTDTFTNRPWDKNNIHPYTIKFDYYYEQSKLSDNEKKVYNDGIIRKVEFFLRKHLPAFASNYLYYMAAKIYYTAKAKRHYKLLREK